MIFIWDCVRIFMRLQSNWVHTTHAICMNTYIMQLLRDQTDSMSIWAFNTLLQAPRQCPLSSVWSITLLEAKPSTSKPSLRMSCFYFCSGQVNYIYSQTKDLIISSNLNRGGVLDENQPFQCLQLVCERSSSAESERYRWASVVVRDGWWQKR